MAENWQEKRSFESTNCQMLDDNILCDVTFLAGSERKEVKAHRFILASRSPVFYAMFCGELAETSDCIEIQDIEADTMSTLLRFIYTEECLVTGELVMSLLYAAKKYSIKRLEQKCQTFLSEQISTENVCDIFNHVHAFSELKLKQKCFNFILANGKNVLQTKGFTTLSRKLLQEVIESDSLEATEADVYDSCKKWATNQLLKTDENKEIRHSDIRNELGDLLYLIRFPTMSLEYFTNTCSEDSVLNPDEKVSIFKTIINGFKSMNLKFDERIRKSMFEKRTVTRLQSVCKTPWDHSGNNADVINFTVSKQVMFWGIGMFTPLYCGEVQGKISLLEKDVSLIKEKHISIYYTGSALTDALFDEAVPLTTDVKYTIRLELKGVSTYSGENGQKVVTEGDLKITFTDSYKSTNSTSVTRGQIPYLVLGINSN